MKTKTIFGIFAALVILLALAVAPVAAKVGDPAFMSLIQKDPANSYATIPGASGKLMYKTMPNSMFVFNGQGLSGDFVLISYAESGASNVLGYGTADFYGNVQVSGKDPKFICNVYAADAPGDYKNINGVKVWLVPNIADNIAISGDTATIPWATAWGNFDTFLLEDDLILKECNPQI